MSKYHVEKMAECPFYSADFKHAVHCEGLTEKSSIHLVFCSQPELKKYINEYCCDAYKKCRIAQMLDKKWEDFYDRK